LKGDLNKPGAKVQIGFLRGGATTQRKRSLP